MLVIAETPSNPRLDLVDLEELGAISGPFTVVDSTFATPIGQQPMRHGVDIVLHSATKGISGQNDATLGVIAGERDLLDAIWAYSVLHGAAPRRTTRSTPSSGIRTLAVRQRHQAAVALRVAEALRRPPRRCRRAPPGPARPPPARARPAPADVRADGAGGRPRRRRRRRPHDDRQRPPGPLGDVARRARDAGVPLGHEHARQPDAEDQAAIGITPGLVRISVGLEDAGDLVADLGRAIPT